MIFSYKISHTKLQVLLGLNPNNKLMESESIFKVIDLLGVFNMNL